MKKILLLLFTLVVSLSSAFTAELSMDFLAVRSTETNIYSDPLPKNAPNSFLLGVINNPYIDRTDYGAKFNANLFFKAGSRVGLSFSFAYGHAVEATETIPVPDDPENSFASENIFPWSYKSFEALSKQKDKLSFAIGPVFRFNYSIVEAGAAIRGVVSTYDFFDSFTVGVEAQPYFRAYFNKWLYITTGLSFTAHLFRFLDSTEVFYEENYTFFSTTPFIGLGVRFGGV